MKKEYIFLSLVLNIMCANVGNCSGTIDFDRILHYLNAADDTIGVSPAAEETDQLMSQLDQVANSPQQKNNPPVVVPKLPQKLVDSYVQAFLQLCKSDPQNATLIAELISMLNVACQQKRQDQLDKGEELLKAVIENLDPDLKRDVQL